MSNVEIESKETEEVEKTFPLLDLPAELWCKIGKLVIDAAPVITTHMLTNHEELRQCGWHCDKIRQRLGHLLIPVAPAHATVGQPAITGTCQVLRLELLPYYYGHNICASFSLNDDMSAVNGWLCSIGAANRRSISGLSFSIEHGEDLEVQQRALAEDYFVSFESRLSKVRGNVVDGDGYQYDKYKVVLL